MRSARKKSEGWRCCERDVLCSNLVRPQVIEKLVKSQSLQRPLGCGAASERRPPKHPLDSLLTMVRLRSPTPFLVKSRTKMFAPSSRRVLARLLAETPLSATPGLCATIAIDRLRRQLLRFWRSARRFGRRSDLFDGANANPIGLAKSTVPNGGFLLCCPALSRSGRPRARPMMSSRRRRKRLENRSSQRDPPGVTCTA